MRPQVVSKYKPVSSSSPSTTSRFASNTGSRMGGSSIGAAGKEEIARYLGDCFVEKAVCQADVLGHLDIFRLLLIGR